MLRWAAAIAVVGCLIVSCGGEDDPSVSSTTSDTSTTTDAATSTAPPTSDSTSTSQATTTSDSTSTTSIAPAVQFVDLYFVDATERATPVVASVPAGPAVAASTILGLIDGPDSAQRAEGLSSAVPPDTELLGLTIENGLARVDFSREFEAGGGTFSMTVRLAQVVYTLTEFGTVDAVEFWMEGEPVTVFSSEGLLLDGPVTRADYLADLPLSPTEVVVAGSDVGDETEMADDETFDGDQRVVALLDDFAAVVSARGDLRAVASTRGLYVSHHAAPIRFRPDELATVLDDPTTYKWPSNALDVDDPDQAQEIPSRTFSEAIADSFVSAWKDLDRMIAWDEPLAGGNGRIPSDAIPDELDGFHFVSVHDPGDNPDYDGLDWISWHVSIEHVGERPVVVGLTLDQWAP